MHRPKLLFFWLSINYASNFLIILSLSYAANPRPMVVKCDGSVYDIEDIYFFEVNPKYISSSVLKTSEFS